MLYYVLIYSYCSIAGLLCYLIDEKAFRKTTVFLSILVLALFSGLRYHTGWDWEAYDYFIATLPGIASGDFFASNVFNYEPLFVITVSVLNELSFSVFFFFSLMTVSLTILSANVYLGRFICVFLVTYLFYGYFHNFSIVRQGIAAALFLYSIRYIESRSFYKYSLIIFVASLFHVSSLILFFIYYIVNNVVPNKSKLLLYIFISFLFVAFPILSKANDIVPFLSIFGNKVSLYLSNENLSYKAGFSLKYLELLILVYIFSFEKYRKLGQGHFGKYFNIFGCLVTVQLGVYSFINDFSILYERISVYFEVSQGIFISMVVVCFRGKVSKFLIISIIFTMVFIRYERLFYHSNNEERLGDEAGHLERFENYCSIFDKETCTR
ncbi:EpsG family protein [Vibrio vulnificus]